MREISFEMENGLHINQASRCAIIGHGSWATAIVKVLTMNELSVGWYVRNVEVLESLRTEGHNCRYLSDVDFDMSRISLSDDLNATVSQAEILFLVTPAAYLKDYLADLRVTLTDKFVVSAIKGIVPNENQFVTEYLRQHYSLADEQVAFISGPTHAEEVGHNKLTYLTIACTDRRNAEVVGSKIQTSFIRLNYLTEVRFLESSSVLKNIYAIVVGMATGMGYGDNFISVLVSNCIAEMYRFLEVNNKNVLATLHPSSFIGDLLVSCYSSHSRNLQFGVLIGRGNTIKTALNEMTMVAEGYFASKSFQYLSPKQRALMPIADIAYQVMHDALPARQAMKRIEGILV